MKKKLYEMPSMGIIELENTVLLAGSMEDDLVIIDYEDPIEEGLSDEEYNGEGL